MKLKNIFSILILSILSVTLISCVSNKSHVNLWENALYTEDVALGEGKKTITLEVEAEGKKVIFTINTDKTTLGDALSEHKLISGEKGAYGLYVKYVNGIYADYDSTKSYWYVNKSGQYLETGVDSTKIEDGDTYQFIYTTE